LHDDFVRGGLPARALWSVETVSTGAVGRSYYSIVIRHRQGCPSVVRMSSCDHEQVEAVRQQVLTDLTLMTCYEFERRYGVKPIAVSEIGSGVK
jgi:hypothetical protein